MRRQKRERIRLGEVAGWSQLACVMTAMGGKRTLDFRVAEGFQPLHRIAVKGLDVRDCGCVEMNLPSSASVNEAEATSKSASNLNQFLLADDVPHGRLVKRQIFPLGEPGSDEVKIRKAGLVHCALLIAVVN